MVGAMPLCVLFGVAALAAFGTRKSLGEATRQQQGSEKKVSQQHVFVTGLLWIRTHYQSDSSMDSLGSTTYDDALQQAALAYFWCQ